jgi:hypothetical protein
VFFIRTQEKMAVMSMLTPCLESKVLEDLLLAPTLDRLCLSFQEAGLINLVTMVGP